MKCKIRTKPCGISAREQVYENYCKTHKYRWKSWAMFNENDRCPGAKDSMEEGLRDKVLKNGMELSTENIKERIKDSQKEQEKSKCQD